MQMAKPQTRSETALQSAVMRFGDDAFRICYMHTKSGKETLTLLSDVFMQYFLDTQTFKSEGEERLWVLRNLLVRQLFSNFLCIIVHAGLVRCAQHPKALLAFAFKGLRV